MTARLMVSAPAIGLDYDGLFDAAASYINARACELLRDTARVAEYLEIVAADEDVVAAAQAGCALELGAVVLKRLDEVAQEAAELEWEGGK